jgi:small subunit ribosomal protein S9
LAEAAGQSDIEASIARVLTPYEREDKEAILGIKRRPVQFDEFGRSYTVGKRKESAARVWIVPTQPLNSSVSATEILINNQPLGSYFANVADRERVLLPFKLTGLVGAFNAFVLTHGGGTTGQAGAAAHGIAKGLAAHVPEAWPILMKAGLLKRDPRMVERKKTGLAKARKRYAWVKR